VTLFAYMYGLIVTVSATLQWRALSNVQRYHALMIDSEKDGKGKERDTTI
jgi:hypothetical protein